MSFRIRLALLAFLLQLPIEFLYSISLSFYLGNAYEVNLVIPKIAFFLVLLFATLRKQFKGYKIGKNHLYLYLFLLSIIIVSVYNLSTFPIAFDESGYNIKSYYLSIIFFYCYYFFIGYNMNLYRFADHYKPFFVVILLLMSTFVLANLDYNTFLLDLDKIVYETNKGYQFWADSYALTSIFTISLIHGWGKKRDIKIYLIFFISIIVLYALHSRTTFYAYAIVIMAYIYLTQNRKVFYSTTVFLLSVATLLFILNPEIFQNRMLGIVFGENDSSLDSRLFMFLSGGKDILEHPISGNFGGQVYEFGYVGYYIHNLLSYWRQFGIISFLILLILLSKVSKFNLKTLKFEKSLDNNELFIYLMFIQVIVSMIFARSITYPFSFMLFGCYLSYINEIRINYSNIYLWEK